MNYPYGDHIQLLTRTWAVDLVRSMTEVRHVRVGTVALVTDLPDIRESMRDRADRELHRRIGSEGWLVLHRTEWRQGAISRPGGRVELYTTAELFVVMPVVPDGTYLDWVNRAGPGSATCLDLGRP